MNIFPGEAGDSSVRAVRAPEQPCGDGAQRRVQPTPLRAEDACINRGWHSPAATSPATLVREKHHAQLCGCDHVGIWREITASTVAPSNFNMSSAQETWRDKRLKIFLRRLLEAESEAHCAQEALESDVLNLKYDEVKLELQKQLAQSKLDAAVKKEIDKYVGLWEDHLVNLEERICRYQEKLDEAGVSLPGLYKWIEHRVPLRCQSRAWKERSHWAAQPPSLKCVLPASGCAFRKYGKLLETGASGYLARKYEQKESGPQAQAKSKSTRASARDLTSPVLPPSCSGGFEQYLRADPLYQANTPADAERLVLDLPGAAEVEELVDVDDLENDPELALALDMEKRHWLTRTQHKTKRKVLMLWRKMIADTTRELRGLQFGGPAFPENKSAQRLVTVAEEAHIFAKVVGFTKQIHKTQRDHTIHQLGICFCNFYVMSKCLQWGPKTKGQVQSRATVDGAITKNMLHSAKVLKEAQGGDHMAAMVAALAPCRFEDVVDADSKKITDGEMENQERALF
eukprot:SM000050S16986  [mRNA]  locus=s50:275940:279154:- [translate_table: standard]